MIRHRPIARLLLLSALTLSFSATAEELPESAQRIVPQLQEWGANPILVEAVREQNALGRSLEDVQRLDADWMGASTVTPFMQTLMDNAPARELKRLEQTRPYFLELFLMDGQGANVAMTNKTSDYWQGDEDKFVESFKQGQGAVHLGEVEFDSSAQAYLVQISVPVMDEGRAIGALTVGIDLDRLEQETP